MFIASSNGEGQKARQEWMAVLAQADLSELRPRLAALGDLPPHHWLRPAEVGLAMVQGRAGGTGQPFCLGEVPICRCVVQLAPPDRDVVTGFGYVLGRSKQHAQLAALGDGLLQIPDWHERVMAEVVLPLAEIRAAESQRQAQQTAATQVQFLTLVRGA